MAPSTILSGHRRRLSTPSAPLTAQFFYVVLSRTTHSAALAPLVALAPLTAPATPVSVVPEAAQEPSGALAPSTALAPSAALTPSAVLAPSAALARSAAPTSSVTQAPLTVQYVVFSRTTPSAALRPQLHSQSPWCPKRPRSPQWPWLLQRLWPGTREPGAVWATCLHSLEAVGAPPPQLSTVNVVHFYFCLFLHVNLGLSQK